MLGYAIAMGKAHYGKADAETAGQAFKTMLSKEKFKQKENRRFLPPSRRAEGPAWWRPPPASARWCGEGSDARVTFDKFDGGLLLARPSSVAPANSLGQAHQHGRAARRLAALAPKWRPHPAWSTSPRHWKGLESNAGYLWVFSCWNVASTGKVSDVVNAETGDKVVYAFRSTGTGGSALRTPAARGWWVTTRWENGLRRPVHHRRRHHLLPDQVLGGHGHRHRDGDQHHRRQHAQLRDLE